MKVSVYQSSEVVISPDDFICLIHSNYNEFDDFTFLIYYNY